MELANEASKPYHLRQMHQRRQVRSGERTVPVAAQGVPPIDPPAPVDELVDMVVVACDVVGAEIDRAVYRGANTPTNVLGDQQERSLTVLEPAAACQAGDSTADDDRFMKGGQRRPCSTTTLALDGLP
jgi:hypothetical protein